MQILYSYFRYTGILFLRCALFVARCNTIRGSWETKKERLSYRKKYTEEFVWGISLFLTARSPFNIFLLLSLSTPSPFASDVFVEWPPIKIYILLWVVFCVVLSWVNSRNMKISYNLILHAFFYKRWFFSTHPQCCLAF